MMRKGVPSATSLRRGISRRGFLGGALAAGVTGPTLASLLAACGGSGGGFSGGGGGAATNVKKFKGKLVIGINTDPPSVAQKALAAAYKKHQPGVDIVWNVQNWGGNADGYSNWLGTQLAAGNISLDIVSGNYQPTFGKYVNLDEYETVTNPYTGNPWDKDLNWNFFVALNAAGQRIMLATQAVHISWYYNEDLFDRAKVSPPSTWDELVDVCEKLQAAGITPIASNYDYMVPQWFAEIYFDQFHVDWVNTVRARPGDWDYVPSLDGKFHYNPDDPNIQSEYTYNVQRFYQGIQKGTLRFDTPQIQQIVTNMAKVFPKYAISDLFVIEDPYPVFLQQKAAIMTDGSWTIPELVDDLAQLTPARLKTLGIPKGSVKPFKWSTFENPAMQGSLIESKHVRSVESASGEYVSIISKNAEQVEMAVDFVMFWLSEPGYKAYLDAYETSDEFDPSGPLEVERLSFPTKYQNLFKQLKFLGNAEANYNGFWTAGAGPSETTDLHNLLRSALEGSISPAQYSSQLQQYMESHFAEMLSLSQLTQQDVDNPARRPAGA